MLVWSTMTTSTRCVGKLAHCGGDRVGAARISGDNFDFQASGCGFQFPYLRRSLGIRQIGEDADFARARHNFTRDFHLLGGQSRYIRFYPRDIAPWPCITGYQAKVDRIGKGGWELQVLVRDPESAPARWIAKQNASLVRGDVTSGVRAWNRR